MQESDVVIITGHYGAGKTNLAVNLAREMAKTGPASLYDLDIVNPYFRSADFSQTLSAAGVTVVAPEAANTNLDLPALSGRLEAALRTGERRLILDVGGDDAGAVALGRFAPLLEQREYQMWYVVNRFRYLTRVPEEAVGLLREIETASRLRVTHIVNNSNLGPGGRRRGLPVRRTCRRIDRLAAAVYRSPRRTPRGRPQPQRRRNFR